MPLPQQPRICHSNRYRAHSACLHCRGIIRHEPWCVSRNPTVSYAYSAVLGHGSLTVQDSLILHALGVVWVEEDETPIRIDPKLGSAR